MLNRRKPLVVVVSVALAMLAARAALAEAWSFGVMSDTQWSPSGNRPDKGVPTEIIDDVNRQFIQAGVKFVVQVGDITQNAGKLPNALDELDIRAGHIQALTGAGIRFFPLRGNHEGTAACADRFEQVFPGLPGTAGFKPADGYGDGSSPDLTGLAGKSYSFTYRNAELVLLDQFVVNDGSPKGKAYRIAEQQPWITRQLEQANLAHRHAFVFGHKNLLGQHHKDNLFGEPIDKADAGDTSPAAQAAIGAFIRSLQLNGVRFYMSGHDHMYYRALVRTPEPAHEFSVQQVITGSCSYKFYEPSAPYSANEQPIACDRTAVGYSIVTVDGPRVSVSYYSAPVETTAGSQRSEISQWKAPKTWILQDTFAYSLNGKQFLIKKGQSLTSIHDSIATGEGFLGTSMAIFGGTNDTTGTTMDDKVADRRDLANLVTTGWSPCPFSGGMSDVLSLWGMHTSLGSERSNPYALSMSYDPAKVTEQGLASGRVRICSRDADGKWVSGVAGNSVVRAIFIEGPYKSEYPLGTYGVDRTTHSVWAVLDHGSEFMVAEPER